VSGIGVRGCSFFLALFLEEDVGIEGAGGKVYVVLDLAEKGLAGHVAVVIAGDGEGCGKALNSVVIIVLFGVFVDVFEFGVAGFEGAAAREVSLSVDVEGDGVVVGAKDGNAFGETALDHGAAFGDHHDAGSFEPDTVDGFDGVILASEVVVDLILRELRITSVGDFVTGVVDPDLDDVDFFAGEDDALVGEEADAHGLGAVAAGELMDGVEVDDDAGWGSAEEAGDVADLADVVPVKPNVTTELFEHLIEELAPALVGGYACFLLRCGAGDVAGLREESGSAGEEAECDRESELLHSYSS